MTPTLARRYTFAGIELVGGLFGIGYATTALLAATTWMWRVVAIVVLAFYAVSFAAGWLLLRDHEWGAELSLYLQVPQLVFVYSDTIVYNLYSGFSASVALTTPLHLSFNLTPGSNATITVLNDVEHVTIGVNVFAVVLLWQLLAYLDARDAKKAPPPLRSLGGAV